MKITYKRKTNGQYDGSKSDKERRYRITMGLFMGLALVTGIVHSAYMEFKPSVAQAAEPQEVAQAMEDPSTLCGLDSVVCPGETVSQAFTATAYSASVDETDDSPCISADNSNICELNIAHETICASNEFPFGTKLHISGNGTDFDCTVHDRMNRRYTGQNYVDIFHGHDKQGAKDFGTKPVQVTKI